MYIPRWKEIANTIQADIHAGKLAPGTSLPSETELASQYRVSRGTAHRAMHELQRHGVVVRKRHSGTVVADPGRITTARIAVFLNTGDFLEQEFLAGIRSALPDEYDLLLCDIRCDARRELQYLQRMAGLTDGIVCIPTCDPANTPLINEMIRKGTKLVCLDCMPEGVQTDAVISDNYEASLNALRFLLEQGHRRIAHFTVDRMNISSLRARYEAYRVVMQEAGVDDKRYLRAFPYDITTRDPVRPVQSIEDALFTLMHLPEPPTAMFCAHDYILSAVVQGCVALEIKIPEDLEIVSFNDCPPFVPYMPGNIHRIVQQAHEMGRIAAERLYRQLRAEQHAPEVVAVAPVFYTAGRLASGEGELAAPAVARSEGGKSSRV